MTPTCVRVLCQVARFRGHAALAGWYLADEPDGPGEAVGMPVGTVGAAARAPAACRGHTRAAARGVLQPPATVAAAAARVRAASASPRVPVVAALNCARSVAA